MSDGVVDHEDEAAFVPPFEVFYAREVEGVLMVAVGLVRHRWLAEELTQEAFLRAHRDWSRVAVHPNPEAWVRRVVINLARSAWRRAGAEARAVLRLGGPTTVPEPSEASADVWQAVGRLSRRQREIVVLRYVEGWNTPEIANLLGIKEGTVRASLHQARRRLAAMLEVTE